MPGVNTLLFEIAKYGKELFEFVTMDELQALKDSEGTLEKIIEDQNPEALIDYVVEKFGADLHATTQKDKWTLMHVASSEGQVEMLRAFHKRGLDPDARDINDATPTIVGAYYVEEGSVKTLIEECGANAALLDNTGKSAREHALSRGAKELGEYLKQHDTVQENTSWSDFWPPKKPKEGNPTLH